ncbi:efflux RND transporter periplasmic adaptor subunit [Frigidibacter albus]|uniref:Efflux RND transporter periplasmic adaptor subunit n=1 Tax=Frigidibacter albus TaxID=1465486 RepID=A0A6L8VKR4_9RHOB|nr:efflux RND transporter periplasmic adaptor subunit [Frigidibacter albus]MZQ90813.1 efflux RND transporter periplasmic adaptor subunit [Frigidibacter albus]NBE32569.1 efflux RND transporter periplasmic adaptor subunit [Frigidibacter albus]GGH61272.1 hemolysin D [Frigidibacter albus]
MPRLSLVVLALLPFGFVLPVAAQEASPEIALPSITVATVGTAVLRDRVIASGLVTPVEVVQVQPLIEGQPIDALLVDVGDTVAKGQPLARLSGTALTLRKGQLEASRAAALAAIAQAEAQQIEAQSTADEAVRVRNRAEQLRAQGSGTQALADQANAQAASALARVTAAEQGARAAEAQRDQVIAQIADIDLQLQRTLVIAPVAGLVTARNAQVGAIASAAGQPMFTLIRDGLLELHADVAERDVLRLAPGQPASLRAAGLAEPLTGTVRLVEPTVDTASRLGRVRIAIDMPDRLRAGMFAEAEVLVAEREALAVPVAAMGAAEVLRVTSGGTVEQAPVTTGIRDGGLIEITSGLFAGEVIVARAGAFVRPGDRINPVPAEAPARATQ